MEGVKNMVTRIFETSVKSKDIKQGKEQIQHVVKLITTQFQQLKTEIQLMKDGQEKEKKEIKKLKKIQMTVHLQAKTLTNKLQIYLKSIFPKQQIKEV